MNIEHLTSQLYRAEFELISYPEPAFPGRTRLIDLSRILSIIRGFYKHCRQA